jgi:hypothetical protein
MKVFEPMMKMYTYHFGKSIVFFARLNISLKLRPRHGNNACRHFHSDIEVGLTRWLYRPCRRLELEAAMHDSRHGSLPLCWVLIKVLAE